MRVSLITTGILELEGLASALGRLFPDHEFHAEPLAPKKPFHGFTANKVLALLQGDPDGHAVTMLRAALGTLIAADDATPAYELAVVLDDLELNNRGNEDVVIEHVRESAKRTLQAIAGEERRARAAGLMRERISFHLAVPMIESWFFGDLAALQTEVPAARWPPVVDVTRDPEDFLTADAAYLADDGSACEAFANKGIKPAWLKTRRSEHPKHYIEWLMRAPAMAKCTTYMEQHEGVRLLKKIDWRAVLAPETRFPYLRALVRDLEEALGPSSCGLAAGGAEALRTSVAVLSAEPVLRNL